MRLRDLFGAEPEPDAPKAPAVPWERLPGEPEQAWILFGAYLQSPSGNVATFAKGANCAGVGTSTIQAYAARWRWHARRAALASHLARARAEGAEAQAQAQGAQMARLAQGHLDAAEEARTALELRGAIGDMSPREVLDYASKAIEIARLLRGEVTERVGLDLSGLSIEELDALEAIRVKAAGGSKP
jgi:hypothetical protein